MPARFSRRNIALFQFSCKAPLSQIWVVWVKWEIGFPLNSRPGAQHRLSRGWVGSIDNEVGRRDAVLDGGIEFNGYSGASWNTARCMSDSWLFRPRRWFLERMIRCSRRFAP